MSANSHLAGQSSMIFETLRVRREEAVLFVEISAPPMNLLGPELVRDLVSLIQRAEADDTIQVLVFKSADPDYFISHVDVNKIKEYRQEAAKLTGEASIALLFRHLSASRLVTIAQIEGRVRGAGSEFVLACDTRFAARESAIFSQPEPALGQIPGGGGVQHLARLIGRARALEVMLGAQDYNAQLAERYGWINRALPASTLSDFVRSLALRIAKFPSSGIVAVKERVMSSFPRAMLIMAGTFGFWRAGVISNAVFAAGVAAVVLVLLGGTTWLSGGFWAPDGPYSRFVSPIIGLVWVVVVSRVLLTRSPATRAAW